MAAAPPIKVYDVPTNNILSITKRNLPYRSLIYNVEKTNGTKLIRKVANSKVNKNIYSETLAEIRNYNMLKNKKDSDKFLMPVYKTTADPPKINYAFINFKKIDGDDLITRINELIKKNDNVQILTILINAISALQWLSEQQYAHGDVKDDNFFVTPDNNVRLLDLGSLKIIEGPSVVFEEIGKVKDMILKIFGNVGLSGETVNEWYNQSIKRKFPNDDDYQYGNVSEKDYPHRQLIDIYNNLKIILTKIQESITAKPGGAAGGLGGAAAATTGGGRRQRKAHKSRKAIKRQQKHRATRNAQRKNA